MQGILNVLKPPGMTSFDVVSYLRRVLQQPKIGHAGTLDPQAAGVLLVCVGRTTRLADYLQEEDKEYLCHLTLGAITDTQDAWGTVIERRPVKNITKFALEKAFIGFRGNIIQKTPMYSAAKLQGVPLYKLARQGKTVETKDRMVTINSLELLRFQDDTATLKIDCSRGAYIRTLCHDLGLFLGTGGYMSFLVRTRVGNFPIEESLLLEDIASLKEKALLPSERCLTNLRKIVLDQKSINVLVHGGRIEYSDEIIGGDVAILDKTGKLWAIGEIVQEPAFKTMLKPKKVLNMG